MVAVVVVVLALRWMEEILHHLLDLWNVNHHATTPCPLSDTAASVDGVVQDSSHWAKSEKNCYFLAMLN